MCGMRIVDRVFSSIRPVLLAGGLLLVLAPGASALTTPMLKSQITDQAGVLGSGQSSVQNALDGLFGKEHVQLWVLLVANTDTATASDYARQTFESNGFGSNDMVLVISVDDQRYGWWETSATGLPGSQVDDLITADMLPRFKAGDYPGGIADFVSALGQQVDAARAPVTQPTAATNPGAGSTSGSSSDSGVATALWVVIAIIAIGAVLVLVLLWFGSWRRARLSAEERDKQTGDLARQANKLLVDTDDALHTAAQDVSFAQAEFDDSDVKPYADAVSSAQDELKQAFAIRQQLDDSTPEDQPTKIKMYNDIIAHCQAAAAKVDEQAKRVAALRDLEKTAPDALAALPKVIDTLQARLPAVQTATRTLSNYAPTSWAAVKGNAEEADKRGHFAETQIAQGKAALAATPPDNNAAAHAARAAQEAVAQANQLLDAVEHLATALDQARGQVDTEIAAADADLTAAKKAAQAPVASGVPATSAADLAKADALLQSAKRDATAAAPDPIAALKSAQAAHAAADQVLAGIRDAAAQQLRVQAAYGSAHQSAATSITQAQAFVASRKDGVGTQARTRLAEAERHFAAAEGLAATDLDGATREAMTAHSMADEASSLAQTDFSGYDRRGPFSGGGFGGPGQYGGPGTSGGSVGANIGGAILGGIIGGMLSGGGRRGGGFGGTPWGSGGGWTGSGGFGGFGGFGGGGGHGGGGGWNGGGGGGGGHGGGGGW
jgi:uncharacterized membrane protein YgcG